MRKRWNASRKAVPGSSALPVIRAKVAGIDIGSQEHFACAPGGPEGTPVVRVFGSTTTQLEALADWLKSLGVESVAMESTGVYWIALYDLLESRGFEVLLVNARHLHHVPGRKSDMQDCQWIQLLHACGLLRGSHRPPEAIGAVRTLRRQCAGLIEERSKVVLWMQKALDQMNVLIHRAVSDLTGKTGMAILRAIVAGERDPQALARHRDARCRLSVEQIAECLRGTWRQEHLFTLAMSLRHYDALQEMIADYEAQILAQLRAAQPSERHDLPVPAHAKPDKQQAMRRHGHEALREELFRLAGHDLTAIDSINCGTALAVLTEVGPDLTAFPDENHFVSWLRLAPFTPKSGGKALKSKKPPKGSTYAANALRTAASSLKHAQCALGAAFRRIARRHGPGVAVFAMARTLAKLVFRMLRYGQSYVDIGMQAYEEQFNHRRLRHIQNSARELGYQLQPLAKTG